MDKISLSKTVVRNTKPCAHKFIVWDSKLANFGLRVYPSGSKSYVLRLTFKDPVTGRSKERMHTIGDVFDFETPDDAREEAQDIRRKYRAGIDVKAAEKIEDSTLITLREAAIGYFISRETRNKESTLTDVCAGLRKSFGQFMDKPVLSLSDDDVLGAYRERKEQAPVRAAIEARYLRALWNWLNAYRPALELGDCPITQLNALKEWPVVEPRKTRLTPQTAPDWLASVRAMKQRREAVLFEFLYFTGCRIGEVLTLRWIDVDLDNDVPRFRLIDTKNRNTIELPLPKQLVTLLTNWRPQTEKTGLLFPAVNRNGDIVPACYPSKVIREHRKDSGVSWSPHDLRRTYVSSAELAGTPSVVVRRLTNHTISNSDAHDGYRVAYVENLIDWSQHIADRLLQWATPEIGKVVELHPEVRHA